jgi:acetyltransferase-like isoleucine patch superfamily enzyme
MAWSIRKVPWLLRYRGGARLGSALRRISVAATHQHCTVEFAGAVRLGPGFHLHIPDAGTLIVGNGVDFRRGFVCEISDGGRVTIGDGTVFTSHALVQCSSSIDIGRRCAFGQSVQIVDGSHRFDDPEVAILDQGYDLRPIVIGDGAWVASKCTVFADIGEHSVVAAHSVVSRPVPPFCLAMGAPARPLRDLRVQRAEAVSAGS